MAEMPERRRAARITVPRSLSGAELELHLVRLVDLSALGARIEHSEPMRQGVVCYVDLPPALGQVRLVGRVVWTRATGSEQTPEGDRRRYYQTGIEFTGLTPQQEAALGAALQRLAAASAEPEPTEPSR